MPAANGGKKHVKNLLYFEPKSSRLASRKIYAGRLFNNGLWGAGIILFSLSMGMFGYHQCEGMSLLDSFVNAAMILSGMGPVNPLNTTCGKVFAGTYALYSGLVLIAVAGLVFAPMFHRMMHRFHIEESKGDG